ncbi:hypothetical protein K438DRAFT_1747060 [Mycena galopus ATCC 62051]|nr:hypothetical protein K438DRAFT_1747060 [Mycena galopus ATCC 62051]
MSAINFARRGEILRERKRNSPLAFLSFGSHGHATTPHEVPPPHKPRDRSTPVQPVGSGLSSTHNQNEGRKTHGATPTSERAGRCDGASRTPRLTHFVQPEPSSTSSLRKIPCAAPSYERDGSHADASPRTKGNNASVATGISGTLVLWTMNPITALLGASNIALYAGLYTWMKRKSIYNTWVGWQFPHFNGLSHLVRGSYAQAGYRMLTVISPRKTRFCCPTARHAPHPHLLRPHLAVRPHDLDLRADLIGAEFHMHLRGVAVLASRRREGGASPVPALSVVLARHNDAYDAAQAGCGTGRNGWVYARMMTRTLRLKLRRAGNQGLAQGRTARFPSRCRVPTYHHGMAFWVRYCI